MSRKAILIPIFTLVTALALLGAIAWANLAATVGQTQALEAQKNLIFSAIASGDRKSADENYKKLVTEYPKNDALAEAVYSTGFSFQYKMWDAAHANAAHKFVVENFPSNSKYAMLSSVELIRSQLRSGKFTEADKAVEKWMSTYKARTEFADDASKGVYLIAQAYSNNKKDSKAQPLFEFVASTYQKTIYGSLSQVRLDAINKNYSAADVVADFLIARYRDNADVKNAIRSLAEYYRTNKEFSQAIHFFSAELETWPDAEDPVKTYREMIYCYIDMNDVVSAREKIDAMQKDLAGNTQIARANFDIANYFLNKGDSESALRLHAYNVKTYTDELESLLSQAAIVSYYIRTGDEENANIEYQKMLSIYKDDKSLPLGIALVGDSYLEADNSEKARSLYQKVLDEWTQSEYVLNARAGFIKADIHDGTDETVMEDINDLIAEFKDNQELPKTIITFGETYYNEGLDIYIVGTPAYEGNTSAKEKSLNNFQKSLTIWLKAIAALEDNTITADNEISAEYYHYAGTCFREVGDYEKAIEYYKTVVNNWTDYESAWYIQFLIPQMYERLRDEGSVSKEYANLLIIEGYQEVIDNYPDSSAVKAANTMIKRCQKQEEQLKKGRFTREIDSTYENNGGQL